MIRRRDQLRLSVQKLALRRKRAAFSVVSVALGMIVVVSINSLINNIRDLVVRTSFTEDIDKNVIRVYTTGNPYESGWASRDKKEPPRRRQQFLTEELFAEIRAWPEIEAADRPITLTSLSFDALRDRPHNVATATGVPDAMLRRYVRDPAQWDAASNAVPVVVGERYVRLSFDFERNRFVATPTNEVNAWLGREMTMVLGDPFANLPRFKFDYDSKQWSPVDDEEMAQRREAVLRETRARFDPTIFHTSLSLRARVVGFCPGGQILVPQDVALLMEKWLTQRRQLAALTPARQEPVEYGARGRITPRAGEYIEGLLLVKEGSDAEAVAKRVKELGFETATRASAFAALTKELDAATRFLKRVAFAFGAVILGLAGGLLMSTTSRIVADSRADIGLFRALGATKADIRRLFLSEAVMLGLLGTVAGMLAGWGLAWLISRWTISFVRREVADPEQMLMVPDSVFSIDAGFCLMLIAGAALFSILAGLWPANRAASVDPVKALKRE